MTPKRDPKSAVPSANATIQPTNLQLMPPPIAPSNTAAISLLDAELANIFQSLADALKRRSSFPIEERPSGTMQAPGSFPKPSQVPSVRFTEHPPLSRPPPPSHPPKKTRIRRPNATLNEDTRAVAEVIAKHPWGISATDLCHELAIGMKQLRLPVRRAVALGLAEKRGVKRGTQYFPPKAVRKSAPRP